MISHNNDYFFREEELLTQFWTELAGHRQDDGEFVLKLMDAYYADKSRQSFEIPKF